MRIDPNTMRIGPTTEIQRGAEGQQVSGSSRPETGTRPLGPRTDEAILSPLAQDIMIARRALAEVPEVRQQRVDELRASVASGSFTTDARQVLERMITSVI